MDQKSFSRFSCTCLAHGIYLCMQQCVIPICMSLFCISWFQKQSMYHRTLKFISLRLQNVLIPMFLDTDIKTNLNSDSISCLHDTLSYVGQCIHKANIFYGNKLILRKTRIQHKSYKQDKTRNKTNIINLSSETFLWTSKRQTPQMWKPVTSLEMHNMHCSHKTHKHANWNTYMWPSTAKWVVVCQMANFMYVYFLKVNSMLFTRVKTFFKSED